MIAVILNGNLHIRDNDRFVKCSRRNLRLALGMHDSWLPHYSKRQLVMMMKVTGDMGKMDYRDVERVHARFKMPDTKAS